MCDNNWLYIYIVYQQSTIHTEYVIYYARYSVPIYRLHVYRTYIYRPKEMSTSGIFPFYFHFYREYRPHIIIIGRCVIQRLNNVLYYYIQVIGRQSVPCCSISYTFICIQGIQGIQGALRSFLIFVMIKVVKNG